MRARRLLSLAEQRMHADLRRSPPCGCGSCTVPCLRRRGPNAAVQPKQVEDPPAVCGEEAQGGSDPVIARETQQADGDVAQGGHDARAIAAADLLTIFIVGHVPHAMGGILNGPVSAIELEQPGGVRVWRSQAGQAIDRFREGLAALDAAAVQVCGRPPNAEHLADVGELQVGVPRGAGPDLPPFDPAMGVVNGAVLRGERRRAPGPQGPA